MRVFQDFIFWMKKSSERKINNDIYNTDSKKKKKT